MTDHVLPGRVDVLLTHLAAWGLADILTESGAGATLRWDAETGRPVLATDLDRGGIGAVVHDHAAARLADDSWLTPTWRGRPTMSPRPPLTLDADPDDWADLTDARHAILDRLANTGRHGDLRMIAALGDPTLGPAVREILAGRGLDAAVWTSTPLDMQPGNAGAEIIGAKLLPLAGVVAGRTPQQVAAGLLGETVTDEITPKRSVGRAAPGLCPPGPLDNAIAWCGLWGIGQTTLGAPRLDEVATDLATDLVPVGAPTGGLHVGPASAGWICVPVWTRPITPGRIRSLLARPDVAILGAAGVNHRVRPADEVLARVSLRQARVQAVMRFPVLADTHGKALSRQAGQGVPVPTSTPVAA